GVVEMKKVLMLMLVSMLALLVACGDDEAGSKQEETSDAKTIELNEEESFADFTVFVNEIKVYEEDGDTLADVSYEWKKHEGVRDKKSFMMMSSFDVEQEGELLEDATNLVGDNKSRYYTEIND